MEKSQWGFSYAPESEQGKLLWACSYSFITLNRHELSDIQDAELCFRISWQPRNGRFVDFKHRRFALACLPNQKTCGVGKGQPRLAETQVAAAVRQLKDSGVGS
jgi:hypothetical protein